MSDRTPAIVGVSAALVAVAIGVGVTWLSQRRQAPDSAPPTAAATSPSHDQAKTDSPLEAHILRLLAILSDRESGDRACSRALDAALALTATHDGRSLLTYHAVLPLLVDLLYRSVPTPSGPPSSPTARRPRSLSSTSASSLSAQASSSSSSSSSSPELLSPDLVAVVAKSVAIISNLSLDLQNQHLLRKLEAFPLLYRFLEDDMVPEIQERSLQAFLNLSVFEGLHEDALRAVGLLVKLPHLLLSEKSSPEVRVLSLKVLRNLVVTNEENRRLLIEADMIGKSLSVLCESETLSQRALELVLSLDPSSSGAPVPPLKLVDLLKLLDVLRTSVSESLADTSLRVLLMLVPHLDRQLVEHLLGHHRANNSIDSQEAVDALQRRLDE